MATTYDKRTGKALREGTSIDYSGIKDPSMLKYDENTGNPLSSISSSNLSGAGQSYNLPPASVPTYGGLPGATEGLVATAKTSAEKNVEELANKKNESGKAYLNELLSSSGISSSVDRSEEDRLGKISDDYLSQLEQEQLSNRRAIESLTKEFKGTSSGLSSIVSSKNKESLSKQADIATLYNIANRSYDRAKSIADRAVQMKLEESKIRLSALEFFYNENKDSFSKADDRLYSEAVKKADAELKKQTEIEEKIRDLKLNVASYAGSNASGILSSLSAIDTTKPGAFDQAVKIAGKYATDPLDRQIKQATLNKLNSTSTTEAPTIKQINGIDKQWDPNTGQWIEPSVSGASSPIDPTVTEKSFDDIKKIKDIASGGVPLATSAGSLRGAPIPFLFKGKINDWRANVKNILAQSTLAELVRVKGSGVTFGALSEGERQAVADASTALNAAMIYEGKGENRVPTGKFKASEKFVKEQLGLIQKYAEIDFKRRTGQTPDEYEADKYIQSISPALESVTSPYAIYTNK